VSENARKPPATEKKKPIQILRDRRRGVPPELVERNRRQTAVRRRILEALRSGAKTVPEIAQETGLPPHEAFWHLMSMRKYGKVVEGQQRDDYFEYALAQESEQTEAAS